MVHCQEIIKYCITNGENYLSDPNGIKLTKEKRDAFLWSMEQAAQNVLSNCKLKTLPNDYHVEEIKTYEAEIDSDIRMDLEVIANFMNIVVDSARREEEYLNLLSTCDKQLSDMEHFIEFNDLNVVDGYKIYKRMQFLRQQRRELKNRIRVCKDINSQSIDPEVLRDLIKYFRTRRYIPRIIDFNEMI